jgi:hypothetical protein
MADQLRRIVYQVKYSYKASILGATKWKSVSYSVFLVVLLLWIVNYTMTYQDCFCRSHTGLFFLGAILALFSKSVTANCTREVGTV